MAGDSEPIQITRNSHDRARYQAELITPLAATVLDFKPIANIPPVGTCNVLTAAALGVPTPCAMAPAGPWQPGSPGRVTIDNLPVLLSTDKLMCTIPGVITVVDPGQQKTEDA